MALFVPPSSLTIEICTDAQSVIDDFTKFDFLKTFSPTNNPLYKILHFPLWFTIFKLIEVNHLTILFKKIKAHTKDNYNNEVDAFAKGIGPLLSLKPSSFGPQFPLFFHNMPILNSPKSFNKLLFQFIRFHNTLLLPHFSQYNTKSINWMVSTFVLNDNGSPSSTSFQNSGLRKQKYKFHLEMLPTIELLKI